MNYWFTDNHDAELEAYVDDPRSGVIQGIKEDVTVIEKTVVEDDPNSSLLEKYKFYLVVFAAVFIMIAITCAIIVGK